MSTLFDLSANGRIRVTGDDRARLIHALSTNHIQQMKPGDRVYAFFLTAQGRILADAHITCFEDSLLIDTETETRDALYRHIDHYIIADDVTLDDETDRTFCFGIANGEAIDRIYGPIEEKEEVRERAGLTESNYDSWRLEHFVPRYGEDITEKTLPQETALPTALHFQKGCYLGQEIVERIRSRGHVNRTLSGLIFEGDALPVGTKLEGDAGEITSSLGKHAIAMLRVTAANLPAIRQPVRAV